LNSNLRTGREEMEGNSRGKGEPYISWGDEKPLCQNKDRQTGDFADTAGWMM